MATENVQTFTDNNFETDVLKAGPPVLVDFWAEWCGPCRMIAPVLEQLQVEYSEKVKIVKLNVDENPSSAMEYGVFSIPTMILFKDGKPAERLVGYMPKPTLLSNTETFLHATAILARGADWWKAQGVNGGVVGGSLRATVPTVVVVGAVLVVLAIRLVVLLVVTDQVVQVKAIVAGDEIDASIGLAAIVLI